MMVETWVRTQPWLIISQGIKPLQRSNWSPVRLSIKSLHTIRIFRWRGPDPHHDMYSAGSSISSRYTNSTPKIKSVSLSTARLRSSNVPCISFLLDCHSRLHQNKDNYAKFHAVSPKTSRKSWVNGKTTIQIYTVLPNRKFEFHFASLIAPVTSRIFSRSSNCLSSAKLHSRRVCWSRKWVVGCIYIESICKRNV